MASLKRFSKSGFESLFFCKKTIAGSVFGVLLLLILISSPADTNNCHPPGSPETAKVQSVYDGDTLALLDGRRIRLLGINATERGKEGKAGQPFSAAAQQALDQLIGKQRQINLYFDQQHQDRYGRYLAYVFSGEVNIAEQLLHRGLAYHVAIPPNLSLSECLAQAENKARAEQRGLWSVAGIPARASRDIQSGGYQRFYGKVVRIAFAGAWWIELEGGVSAVIYPQHQHRFSQTQIAAWQDKIIELEGWLYRGRSSQSAAKAWRVKLETPYAVSLKK